MAFNLSNKVFIVTGSASGMGLSTAQPLLERGASVAFCDINQPGLDAVISSISREQKAKALTTSVDITNATAVSSFFQTAKQHFGKIDGIANFAGTSGHKLGLENVWETRPKEFDFIMDLNVKGLYHVLSEGLKPGYLEEPGSIVHISSMYSARGYKKGAVFSASKHAQVREVLG
jgi:NAD(P)-dependent dehydrogenase (short-subunit alcohol dehydrogenase family)